MYNNGVKEEDIQIHYRERDNNSLVELVLVNTSYELRYFGHTNPHNY